MALIVVVALFQPSCNLADPKVWPSHVREDVFGYSVENRPLNGIILGSGPKSYFLSGVIHGNEPMGQLLLEEFIKYLSANPDLLEGKQVILLPVGNPDGLARNSRVNYRGVDLNRNFPSRNWQKNSSNGAYPGSEPETKIMIKVIRQFQPTRVLSVHSPLRMVNYDGPAEQLAQQMAAACGYPAKASVGYPTPGSLGSYTGKDWNIPTITLEVGQNMSADEIWQRFRRALEIFIEIPGAAPEEE